MMPANLNDAKQITGNILTHKDYLSFGISTFKQANEFRVTALTLYNNLELFRQTSLAITSNAALACELYIKSIVASLYDKKLSGHFLDKLFLEIKDNDIQERIKKTTNRRDFDIALSNISNAFSIVRYANEYKGMTIELEFILRFMNALHKECEYLCEAKRIRYTLSEEQNNV